MPLATVPISIGRALHAMADLAVSKKHAYITDFFDIQRVAGSGSFGTVFQAQLRCENDSGQFGSNTSSFALKKYPCPAGMPL